MKARPEFSRFDEISVRVAYGDHPGWPPAEVFDLRLTDHDLGGRPWDDDAFVAELEPLFDRNSYTLNVNKGHGSWGADGASAEILVYIANHAAGGLIDAAAVASVLKVFRGLKAKVGDSNHASTRTPEEIADFARWRVQAAFRDWLAPDADLRLIEEIRDVSGVWTGTFADAEGNTYGVDVHLLDGAPYATRVTRKAA